MSLAWLALAVQAALAPSLPPAPLKLWDVAWGKDLVEHQLLEWKPREMGGPAVDPERGLVVVGTRDGWLRTLRPSGAVVWEFRAAGPFEAPARIEGDRVYVGCGDGRLYALELVTGRELWRYDTHEEVGTTPAIAGGVLYVATLQDTIFALDARNGTWKWHRRHEGTGGFTIRGAAGAAVAGDTVFAAYSDGTVAALDAGSGAVRWERKVAPAGDFVDIDSTPQIQGNRVYVAAYSGAVFALDVATGKALWQFKTPAATRLKLGEGMLVAVSTARVFALSPQDGKELWSTELGGVPWGEPVVAAGRVLVPNTTSLLWLDGMTGRRLRAFDPGSGVSATPAVAGRRVYVLSNAGELFALDLR